MMELKLRAWNRHTKTMQPVKYLRWLANGNIASIGCGDETGFQERLRPRDCMLMRYTGLKDKNGREIYEGDVVTGTTTYEVRWLSGEFRLCVPGDNQPWYSLVSSCHLVEVIGNIYEPLEKSQ